jgi:hypothetical protein
MAAVRGCAHGVGVAAVRGFAHGVGVAAVRTARGGGVEEDFERQQINEYRWWSLDEIQATSEMVVPLGMADLLAEVAAGRVPARPVALPSHH